MIDVYAVTGTFGDKHSLAKDLAAAVMRWEQVPPISLFSKNTAAFIHDLPSDSVSNVDGDSTYVRVQVLTPVGDPLESLRCPQGGEARGGPFGAGRNYAPLAGRSRRQGRDLRYN